MLPHFHLSIGVHSVDESLQFFVGLLGAVLTHRDPTGYANVDLQGTQITLTPAPGLVVDSSHIHFGLNLDLADFERMAAAILGSGYTGVVSRPRVVDEGTPRERRKMYVTCPSGWRIELKGYAS